MNQLGHAVAREGLGITRWGGRRVNTDLVSCGVSCGVAVCGFFILIFEGFFQGFH